MDFLIKLQNVFLGLVSTGEEGEEDEDNKQHPEEKPVEESDDDVDGVPLDGAALLKAGARAESGSEDDLDGAPIQRPADTSQTPSSAVPKPGGFVTSKWETVDPEDVKAGAMTTSKWEVEETDQLLKARKALMGSVASKWDDIDGDPIEEESDTEQHNIDTRVTEERRALLRDIEVKVMQYQDELECGKKGIKSGWTISEQVEHYRKKLFRRAAERQEDSQEEEEDLARERERNKKKKRRRSRSDSDSRSRSREKKSRRRRRSSESSPSPDRRRDRSRSRERKRSERKSRSRSPRKHKKKR